MFRLEQLIAILGATPSQPLTGTVERITTDSRQVQPGDVFLALAGERWDGHDFVPQALDQGAVAAIVQRPDLIAPDLPLLLVPDTLTAYQTLAAWWRKRFTIPVIAVTGSAGKTTTKELIAAVLSTQGRVLKTSANENNDIGVPKTLLQLSRDDDYVVLEMGMRGRGEIARLAHIAQPDVGVITTVGTAHIGRLGSRTAIAQAKCELFAHLQPQGTAIYWRENKLLHHTAKTVWEGRTCTYGFTEGELQAQIVGNELISGNWRTPLPLAGEHNALNFLAALAVAKTLGVPWPEQPLALDLPPGRSRWWELASDILLLDETYNASPEAVCATLKTLKQTPGQRHIAVLGAMRELGENSAPLHAQVGTWVGELQYNYLILLNDPEILPLARAAKPVPVTVCDDHKQIIDHLNRLLQPGDRVLVKASHSIGLGRVVQALTQGG
ncbi:UDP-N-acetylmuramoylalanyl-D-glutamyl-2,6- diaminopimelate--D-alanyl-D-alanine ligase [Gloeomargarita lithophora Alchichica-D10]|uniref:UDP-N-acetylmuramoyl-tripeptide--D-alanyl-D-alanine ligase n=1 Tax=Gloeomargarita lithophora Alchichica-D10 TaxID=1188229 RepID=A0A1J0A9J9_9CYAN|nr:UDP-N-acetylmuramoyl-tripeptide--D-alanyl-D-alanine ligase [Gloeomargarita lithophora]APB32616.1 UDP-N-acetylmuramoylalanyl-D-glutamyl-2,6- diaminopimelate--D-alanyl-D-alanine ligase [Gloeomargarita lithophora Alchichica-D10]